MRHRAGARNVNVYLPYGSDTAQFQVGGSPSGPWSKPQALGRTMGGEQRIYRVEFATG